jgi:hypothetical protein
MHVMGERQADIADDEGGVQRPDHGAPFPYETCLAVRLGDFITQVQAAPLRAELTSDQRKQLLDDATQIRSALAPTKG